MATIRRIATYKIFINKQVNIQMLTIRLALYIFYNAVQSKLDSSHAMRAGDAWIGQLAMFISQRCDLFR